MDAVSVSSGNAVIFLTGEIDMASADSVSSALEPAVESGGPVVVDVSGVTFIDSTGLHAFLKAAQTLGRRGCVIIHGAHGPIARVFELTQLGAIQPNIHILDCPVLVAA